MRIKNIFIALSMLLTFSACDTISQMASFINCKYDIKGLSNPTVSGISLSNTNNINNLNATSLLKLGVNILSGSLPFQTTLNINASNPNTGMASIEGLEWAIDLDNSNILTGMVNNRITIPANASTVIPITIQVDIMQLLKGESKDNVFKFVNNLLNIGDNEASNMTFRVKPTISVAGQKISTGFININKSVK